ncbi:hypothetical protein N657DRAFT_681159 [Parathielavia appendiculata]|uniref:Uncharacterized protein n=1 Tax=Parathielavia appendiculata TaxID=2587402 RepID=A0AAN6Z3R8_9PEZI|nr:hypothetical protein N657DRAFT_681159 [Parathielavia appendiculata]
MPSLSPPEPPAGTTPSLQCKLGRRQMIIEAMASIRQQFQLRNATEQSFYRPHKVSTPPREPSALQRAQLLQPDRFGSGPWPGLTPRSGDLYEFQQSMSMSGFNLQLAWSSLPEYRKEEFRALSEARPRVAWADFDAVFAHRMSSPSASQPNTEEGAAGSNRTGKLDPS